jgi:hypothetical protein
MGDPASSYTTASIALRILEALKPPHPDLSILHQGVHVIEGGNIYTVLLKTVFYPLLPILHNFIQYF